ncbi:hypothetical protein ZWY2020_014677 [Hordeum vulgare]|nr:hypothetical protein ZWY2020_014677 [Hordeum vulgare]
MAPPLPSPRVPCWSHCSRALAAFPVLPCSFSLAQRPSYREVLMTRTAGDGQARPKRHLPADSAPRLGPGVPAPVPEGVPAVAYSRSSRGGADRPERSPEFYSGTSLHRPRLPVIQRETPACRFRARLGMFVVGRLPACGARMWTERRRSGPSWWLTLLRSRVPGMERPLGSRPLGLRPLAPQSQTGAVDGVALPARIAGMLLFRFMMHIRGWPTRPAVGLIGTHLGRMDRTGAGMTGLSGGSPRDIGLLSSRRCRLWPRRRRSLRKEGANFSSECEAPPRCPTTLAYLGYGTERGSFYFVDAEIEEEVPRPHLASVTLAPEQVLPTALVILAELIQDELAAYIGDFRDSEFTWEVTETAPLVFSVPFPSTELLRVCSHDFFCCPINKFLISMHVATAEPELVLPLEKVWVLVYGLPRGCSAAPRGGKLTHILNAISEPAGKLVTVDLTSFEDDGPAHIEILCPASTEIDDLSLIFYFGSRGRRLTFELESPAAADLHGPAPDAPHTSQPHRAPSIGAWV